MVRNASDSNTRPVSQILGKGQFNLEYGASEDQSDRGDFLRALDDNKSEDLADFGGGQDEDEEVKKADLGDHWHGHDQRVQKIFGVMKGRNLSKNMNHDDYLHNSLKSKSEVTAEISEA